MIDDETRFQNWLKRLDEYVKKYEANNENSINLPQLIIDTLNYEEKNLPKWLLDKSNQEILSTIISSSNDLKEKFCKYSILKVSEDYDKLKKSIQKINDSYSTDTISSSKYLSNLLSSYIPSPLIRDENNSEEVIADYFSGLLNGNTTDPMVGICNLIDYKTRVDRVSKKDSKLINSILNLEIKKKIRNKKLIKLKENNLKCITSSNLDNIGENEDLNMVEDEESEDGLENEMKEIEKEIKDLEEEKDDEDDDELDEEIEINDNNKNKNFNSMNNLLKLNLNKLKMKLKKYNEKKIKYKKIYSHYLKKSKNYTQNMLVLHNFNQNFRFYHEILLKIKKISFLLNEFSYKKNKKLIYLLLNLKNFTSTRINNLQTLIKNDFPYLLNHLIVIFNQLIEASSSNLSSSIATLDNKTSPNTSSSSFTNNINKPLNLICSIRIGIETINLWKKISGGVETTLDLELYSLKHYLEIKLNELESFQEKFETVYQSIESLDNKNENIEENSTSYQNSTVVLYFNHLFHDTPLYHVESQSRINSSMKFLFNQLTKQSNTKTNNKKQRNLILENCNEILSPPLWVLPLVHSPAYLTKLWNLSEEANRDDLHVPVEIDTDLESDEEITENINEKKKDVKNNLLINKKSNKILLNFSSYFINNNDNSRSSSSSNLILKKFLSSDKFKELFSILKPTMQDIKINNLLLNSFKSIENIDITSLDSLNTVKLNSALYSRARTSSNKLIENQDQLNSEENAAESLQIIPQEGEKMHKSVGKRISTPYGTGIIMPSSIDSPNFIMKIKLDWGATAYLNTAVVQRFRRHYRLADEDLNKKNTNMLAPIDDRFMHTDFKLHKLFRRILDQVKIQRLLLDRVGVKDAHLSLWMHGRTSRGITASIEAGIKKWLSEFDLEKIEEILTQREDFSNKYSSNAIPTEETIVDASGNTVNEFLQLMEQFRLPPGSSFPTDEYFPPQSPNDPSREASRIEALHYSQSRLVKKSGEVRVTPKRRPRSAFASTSTTTLVKPAPVKRKTPGVKTEPSTDSNATDALFKKVKLEKPVAPKANAEDTPICRLFDLNLCDRVRNISNIAAATCLRLSQSGQSNDILKTQGRLINQTVISSYSRGKLSFISSRLLSHHYLIWLNYHYYSLTSQLQEEISKINMEMNERIKNSEFNVLNFNYSYESSQEIAKNNNLLSVSNSNLSYLSRVEPNSVPGSTISPASSSSSSVELNEENEGEGTQVEEVDEEVAEDVEDTTQANIEDELEEDVEDDAEVDGGADEIDAEVDADADDIDADSDPNPDAIPDPEEDLIEMDEVEEDEESDSEIPENLPFDELPSKKQNENENPMDIEQEQKDSQSFEATNSNDKEENEESDIESISSEPEATLTTSSISQIDYPSSVPSSSSSFSIQSSVVQTNNLEDIKKYSFIYLYSHSDEELASPHNVNYIHSLVSAEFDRRQLTHSYIAQEAHRLNLKLPQPALSKFIRTRSITASNTGFEFLRSLLKWLHYSRTKVKNNSLINIPGVPHECKYISEIMLTKYYGDNSLSCSSCGLIRNQNINQKDFLIHIGTCKKENFKFSSMNYLFSPNYSYYSSNSTLSSNNLPNTFSYTLRRKSQQSMVKKQQNLNLLIDISLERKNIINYINDLKNKKVLPTFNNYNLSNYTSTWGKFCGACSKPIEHSSTIACTCCFLKYHIFCVPYHFSSISSNINSSPNGLGDNLNFECLSCRDVTYNSLKILDSSEKIKQVQPGAIIYIFSKERKWRKALILSVFNPLTNSGTIPPESLPPTISSDNLTPSDSIDGNISQTNLEESSSPEPLPYTDPLILVKWFDVVEKPDENNQLILNPLAYEWVDLYSHNIAQYKLSKRNISSIKKFNTFYKNLHTTLSSSISDEANDNLLDSNENLSSNDLLSKRMKREMSRIDSYSSTTPVSSPITVAATENTSSEMNEILDTYVSAQTLQAALCVSGAACYAVDIVMKNQRSNVFLCTRPPGHHAGRNGFTSGCSSTGFCLFNNAAIALLYSRIRWGLKRVAVIDFDVHFGNGTADILKDYPDTFFASLHMIYGKKNDGNIESKNKNKTQNNETNENIKDDCYCGFYPVSLGLTEINKNYISIGIQPSNIEEIFQKKKQQQLLLAEQLKKESSTSSSKENFYDNKPLYSRRSSNLRNSALSLTKKGSNTSDEQYEEISNDFIDENDLNIELSLPDSDEETKSSPSSSPSSLSPAAPLPDLNSIYCQPSNEASASINDEASLNYEGSTGFIAALREIVIPRLEEFDPELLIISAGFDGFQTDPLGGDLHLTLSDYTTITRILNSSMEEISKKKNRPSRIVSLLEGGYDTLEETQGLAKCVNTHVEALRENY